MSSSSSSSSKKTEASSPTRHSQSSPGKRGASPRKQSSPSASPGSRKTARIPEYRECPHIPFTTVEFINKYRRTIGGGSLVCTQCSLPDDGAVQKCLECGVGGCLEADRLHLPTHFASMHPDTLQVAVSPTSGLLFCWHCQQFVWNAWLDELWMEAICAARRADLPLVPADRLVAVKQDTEGIKRHCVTLRGLHNLGKTCFMNAGLQVLLHNPHLIQFFLSVGHDIRSCKRAAEGTGASSSTKKRGPATGGGGGGGEVCIACQMDTLFVEVWHSSTPQLLTVCNPFLP